MTSHHRTRVARQRRGNSRDRIHIHSREEIIELRVPLHREDLRPKEMKVRRNNNFSFLYLEGIMEYVLNIGVGILCVELILNEVPRPFVCTHEETHFAISHADFQGNNLLLPRKRVEGSKH